jgi:hypothetical protein
MRRRDFGARNSHHDAAGARARAERRSGFDVDRARRHVPSPIAIGPRLVEVAQEVRRVRSVRALRVTASGSTRGRCPATARDRPAATGAQPPMSSTGTRSRCAFADRGHAVRDTRPGGREGRRRRSPSARRDNCAMCTPAPSSRTSKTRTPALAQADPSIGVDVPPCHAGRRLVDATGTRTRLTHSGNGAGCTVLHRESSEKRAAYSYARPENRRPPGCYVDETRRDRNDDHAPDNSPSERGGAKE